LKYWSKKKWKRGNWCRDDAWSPVHNSKVQRIWPVVLYVSGFLILYIWFGSDINYFCSSFFLIFFNFVFSEKAIEVTCKVA